MIPTPRYNKKYPVTKLREPKRRRYVSDKIVSDSLIKKRLTIDCGPPIKTRDASADDELTVMFSGYRFVQPRETNSGYDGASVVKEDLTWNDGVFWSYNNNFSQLPLGFKTVNRTDTAAGGYTTAPQDPPAGTTTALIKNRQLFGGSVVMYVRDQNDEAMYLDDTKNPNPPQHLGTPFIGVSGTNQIHQYDQRVEFTEEMVFTSPVSGSADPEGKFMFPSPIPPTNKGYNMTDDEAAGVHGQQESREYSVSQLKLTDCLRFTVRNIILLVPANYPEDGTDLTNEFGRLDDSDTRGVLEQLILKQLFQKTEGGCGPPSKKNEDLYRRVNPEFKVLRDWKQRYSFSSGGRAKACRTKFYHRYNHGIGTMCRLEKELDAIISSGGSNQVQQELGDDDGAVADATVGGEDDMADDQPIVTGAATERGTKRQRTEDYGDEDPDDPKYNIYRKTGTSFNGENYKVFNPQTHRIVWLRLPRFTGTLELQDINQGTYLPTTFLNQKGTKYCIENCGTRMRGYSEWNILKPEITNTGGTTAQVSFSHPSESGGGTSVSHAGVTSGTN